MVSSSTVVSNSEELKQTTDNYVKQVENLSSSWKGDSYNNLSNQVSSFQSELQQVINQLTSFAEALGLYETYKEYKDKYNQYSSLLSQLGDSEENQSLISQYMSIMNECKAKMDELAPKIQDALSSAAGFNMDSTTSSTTATTSATLSTKAAGEFVADSSKGVYGHMVTSLNGRTHTIYKQSQIKGWSRDCNRAAASSIASAFTHYDGEAVDIAMKADNGIGYKSDVTNEYFSNFGLKATVNKVNGPYDTVTQDIISTLNRGDYVMFDLANPNVVGQSGQRWSFTRHWLSVLDIKKTGEGENDYAIFISDSGHAGSTKDHGLGAGWYDINEFSGQQIANLTTISSEER